MLSEPISSFLHLILYSRKTLRNKAIVALRQPKLSSDDLNYAKCAAITIADKVREGLIAFGDQLIDWIIRANNPSNYLKSLERVENISLDEVNKILPKLMKLEALAYTLMEPE